MATGYQTADAQERQLEIKNLTAQLEQLQYAYAYNTVTAADTANLDSELLRELTAFVQDVNRRDLTAVSEMSAELKGLILRRSTDETDLASIQSQMSSLQSQLDQLRTVSTSDTTRIIAPSSGYFSGTVDGFEAILTPDRLSSITAADLDGLTAAEVPESACGRLITDSTWYYVTSVQSEYLKESEVGDRVSVSFSHDFYTTLTSLEQKIRSIVGSAHSFGGKEKYLVRAPLLSRLTIVSQHVKRNR